MLGLPIHSTDVFKAMLLQLISYPKSLPISQIASLMLNLKCDGMEVGSVVGFPVGCLVGDAVEYLVGDFVGRLVGSLVIPITTGALVVISNVGIEFSVGEHIGVCKVGLQVSSLSALGIRLSWMLGQVVEYLVEKPVGFMDGQVEGLSDGSIVGCVGHNDG